MKNIDNISRDIRLRFKEKTGYDIQEGTVMDFFMLSNAESMEDAYKEIESNKNPHLYTGLKGENIDDLGFMFNCPRLPNESDEQYLFRLMNWSLSAEASNTTAINNSLLSLEYSSNAEYKPLVNGCGTGAVFIIPKSYDEDILKKALEEVKTRLAKVVSPSLHIEYIIPKVIPVKLHLFVDSDGDKEIIKDNIEKKIKLYVNNIPPRSSLKIGAINKIGVEESMVDFFNTMQVFIDDKENRNIEIIQKIENKFILDEIIWV